MPTRPHLPFPGFAEVSHALRLGGMALCFIGIAVTLARHGCPWWVWIGPSLHCLAWPTLARRWTRVAADPLAQEGRNLLVDHAALGLWSAAMSFSIFPLALMLAMASTASMLAGGMTHVLRGLAAHGAGLLAGLFLYGFAWQPNLSMIEMLAWLPLLLGYPLAVGGALRHVFGGLRGQREELRRLSQYDDLSGLYNRRSWDLLVQAEFQRYPRARRPVTLAMIDLDHFKQINDRFGHAEGDAVIREFGARLRRQLRASDLPGRYGGEEFGILLPDTRARDAVVLMRRLQEDLRADRLLPGEEVTISIGLAELTPDIESHEAWVRLADRMLYRAKYEGRDRLMAVW